MCTAMSLLLLHSALENINSEKYSAEIPEFMKTFEQDISNSDSSANRVKNCMG